MKKFTRLFLFTALILTLFTAACSADRGAAPTLAGTVLPEVVATSTLGGYDTTAAAETATTAGLLDTPTANVAPGAATEVATLAGSPGVVPVTGMDIMLVECQFCVDNLAHALLVLPDTATFNLVNPSTSANTTPNAVNTNCSTIEVNNGKQVVLCSGLEQTPILLNICTGTNCTNFPVQLQACPLPQQPAATAAPNNNNNNNNNNQPTPGNGGGGAVTDTPVPTTSPTAPAAETATATATP